MYGQLIELKIYGTTPSKTAFVRPESINALASSNH